MTEPEALRVDIVSDVVCPWCIIGFLQLQTACSAAQIGIEVFWHPFELNPQMPDIGQDIVEHVAEKYGSTPQQSKQARERLTAIGNELNFTFNYNGNRRIYNTFQAHQLIHSAAETGMAHQVKMALFNAYFTDNRNVSDPEVLADVAAQVGMDRQAVLTLLQDQIHAKAVRDEENFWTSQGIQGVPAMVFERKYLVTGAQGVESYTKILEQLSQERAA